MLPVISPVAASLRQLAQRLPARRVTAFGAVALVLLLAGATAISLLAGGRDGPPAQWSPAAGPSATPGPLGTSASPTAAALEMITLSAVGDVILGDAGRLPARDGDGFFDGVAAALAADLVMGNLEQPLTGDTGFRKCGGDASGCHAFRAPPHYAAHLREAGFQLMNLANNHGNDYGPEGRANTRAALEEHGIAHTGALDQITVADVNGVAVAVVGFSPYEWTNSVVDLAQAAGVVARAEDAADLVVVQAHLGAEGADQTRVRPGTETFFGENRGDPMAFARAVIEAGADLVVGHGPHVMRGLEFYQGKLIAYSLGNFAGGGGTLSASGVLGQGAVLKVSLSPDGTFVSGELIATHMYDAGLPTVDQQRRGLTLVREVTERDFPRTGARLDKQGRISAPEGQ
jgi:poly-gamma-glutamate capsule biosynthesis protein CapA/YwtB (metallophosphatase superfamily)